VTSETGTGVRGSLQTAELLRYIYDFVEMAIPSFRLGPFNRFPLSCNRPAQQDRYYQ